MERRERIRTEMAEGNVGRLVLTLAIPNTIGLLVVAAYSLADSFFVSTLGTEAGAAVGVTFSLHVLVQAVGYTLGMGAGSLLSRAMGKRDEKTASRYVGIAFFLSLLIGTLITILGFSFCEELLRLLGARGEVLPLARAYVRPFLLCAPIMCAVFVLSQTLRAEGLAFYSMLGLVVGSLLNIVLDPILITYFGMGIAGASVATLISQCISLIVLALAYLTHRSTLTPFGGPFYKIPSAAGNILLAGLPSLLRQGLAGVATILLNHAASQINDATVNAMSLVARIFLLVFSLCLGIGQGMMPVVGYNMGSGNYERMKKAFRFSLFAGTLTMFLIGIPLFWGADKILSLFQNDPTVISVGAAALRAQSAVLFTHGIVTSTILYLQATGHAIQGTILASARQGIFFLPLIRLLPHAFGLQGLICIQPTADALSFLFAIPFLWFAFRKLKKASF